MTEQLLIVSEEEYSKENHPLQKVLYGIPPLIAKGKQKKLIKYYWELDAIQKQCILKGTEYPNISDLLDYATGVPEQLKGERAYPYLISASIKCDVAIERMVYLDKAVMRNLENAAMFMKWNKAMEDWEIFLNGIKGSFNNGNIIVINPLNKIWKMIIKANPEIRTKKRSLQTGKMVTACEFKDIAYDMMQTFERVLVSPYKPIAVFTHKNMIDIKENILFVVEAWVDYVRWSEKSVYIQNLIDE